MYKYAILISIEFGLNRNLKMGNEEFKQKLEIYSKLGTVPCIILTGILIGVLVRRKKKMLKKQSKPNHESEPLWDKGFLRCKCPRIEHF